MHLHQRHSLQTNMFSFRFNIHSVERAIMSKARSLSFLMTTIGLLMIEVDAKPTVDENPSFESTNFYETVNQTQEQLPELKNLLESLQPTDGAIKLCEYETLYSHRPTVFVNIVQRDPKSNPTINSDSHFSFRFRQYRYLRISYFEKLLNNFQVCSLVIESCRGYKSLIVNCVLLFALVICS